MGSMEGKVAVVTGAGRGIGREHALLFAREGAKVVVNDLGDSMDGSGSDAGAAQEVVEEITRLGGQAIADGESVSSWEGARRLIGRTIETFGDLNILVNNAGILRDRTIVNMTENEWDAVIEVHLKGHFAPLRFAAEYWRDQSKAGRSVRAAVVNTSSGSGLFGNPGQANYSAAKAGIASLTVVAARELARSGVRVNAIAPVARTRLTESVPGLAERLRAPAEEGAFDAWHPANISPLVAYLCSDDCHLTGQVFGVGGGEVTLDRGWTIERRFVTESRWDIEALRVALKDLPAGPPPIPGRKG